MRELPLQNGKIKQLSIGVSQGEQFAA